MAKPNRVAAEQAENVAKVREFPTVTVEPLETKVIKPKVIHISRRSRGRRRKRGKMRRRGRAGKHWFWRAWRLQVIPWSPPLSESYILPVLVLGLIGVYIYFAVSFYNSSDVS